MWYLKRGGRIAGTTLAQLQEAARAGMLREDDRVSRDGSQIWVAAKKVPELFPPEAPPVVNSAIVVTDSPVRPVSPRKPRRWRKLNRSEWIIVCSVGALIVGISGIVWSFGGWDYLNADRRAVLAYLHENLGEPDSIEVIAWTPLGAYDGDAYKFHCDFAERCAKLVEMEQEQRQTGGNNADFLADRTKRSRERLENDVNTIAAKLDENPVRLLRLKYRYGASPNRIVLEQIFHIATDGRATLGGQFPDLAYAGWSANVNDRLIVYLKSRDH